MVVDTSALLAIFLLEPEAERFAEAIRSDPVSLLSAVNFVEASVVLDARIGGDSHEELDAFLSGAGIEIEPVSTMQARIAREAYRAYGKGNHAAGLNFGDCFSYALARATEQPLLFKGEDFARTDITPAL